MLVYFAEAQLADLEYEKRMMYAARTAQADKKGWNKSISAIDKAVGEVKAALTTRAVFNDTRDTTIRSFFESAQGLIKRVTE